MKILFGIILIIVILFIGAAFVYACIDSFRKEKSVSGFLASILISTVVIFIGFNLIKFIAIGSFTHKKVVNKPQVEAKKEAEPKTPAQIAKENEQKEKDAYQQWINNQFSPWDGSHRDLVRMVKERMNNPKSFEHVQTTYEDKGFKKGITVLMTYRGTNAFGGIVTNQVIGDVDYEKNQITMKEVQ